MASLKEKKTSWSSLKKTSKRKIPILSTRSQEMEEKYRKHREVLALKGLTLSEYIDGKYFLDNKPYIFVPNEFPYEFEEGVEHWLLWLNPDFKRPSSKVLRGILEKEFGDSEFITFENREEHKSVPGVEHIHILKKRES